ncbi:MAG TPA: ROK family protein [Chloroflexia bacterium]|nr:ROK family protein [Chloroflexia bacterium]
MRQLSSGQWPSILGLDVGGTKMAVGVCGPDGKPVSYLRAPTPRNLDGEGLLQFVVDLARQAISESRITPEHIGVGCGGPMLYPEGIVSPLHIPVWFDFPLRQRLEEIFQLPAVVDNDAKALALGEAYFGSGQSARNLLGMTVSTGVGGGIVTEGKLYHGASGNAGHIGHVIVSEDGPVCECGAIGCLTAYASGTGMALRAREALREGQPSSLATLPPEQVTAQSIAQAAQAGDSLAGRLYQDAATALGRAIASAANLFDLDRVVLGGGLTEVGPLLFDPLRAELKRRACLSFSRNLDVRQAALGREAGVIGAASLIYQNL